MSFFGRNFAANICSICKFSRNRCIDSISINLRNATIFRTKDNLTKDNLEVILLCFKLSSCSADFHINVFSKALRFVPSIMLVQREREREREGSFSGYSFMACILRGSLENNEIFIKER